MTVEFTPDQYFALLAEVKHPYPIIVSFIDWYETKAAAHWSGVVVLLQPARAKDWVVYVVSTSADEFVTKLYSIFPYERTYDCELIYSKFRKVSKPKYKNFIFYLIL